jgi:hypothetical protein
MPFGHSFNDIDRIIMAAAKECDLDYVRGDRLRRPGSIVAQILQDLRHAAVVVADISDMNPNVFYELGIAHQILGPERVVIITQPSKDPPYDVHEFRQLVYTHDEEGRLRLRQELPRYLKAAAMTGPDKEVWSVIRGRLPRTRVLVRDLNRLVEESDSLENVVIRMVAGLGSLAISDHEPLDDEGPEYRDNLLLERNLVRRALRQGARLRLVLNPPRQFATLMLPERLKVRYERLIGLLEGRSDIVNDRNAAQEDIVTIERCDFALTSVPMPNLIILGETVAYEGMKRGGTRGFEMTHCETERISILELIEQFEQLFEQSGGGTITRDQAARQLRTFYSGAIAGMA